MSVIEVVGRGWRVTRTIGVVRVRMVGVVPHRSIELSVWGCELRHHRRRMEGRRLRVLRMCAVRVVGRKCRSS